MAVAKNAPAPAQSKMEAFLLAEAINNAPAWMPGENEDQAVLHGVVIGLAMGRDSGYGVYPVIIYKLESDCGILKAGTYAKVHAFHTLLRNQLAEAGTKIGSEQMLSYRGKKRKNNATQEEIDKGLADYHLTFVQNIGAEFTAVAEDFAF